MLLVGAAVAISAAFSLLSRPPDGLAAYWATDAVLLGIFMRFPRTASVANLIVAYLAMMGTEAIVTGASDASFGFNLANVTGVAVGYLAYRWVGTDIRLLNRPLSVLQLLLISALATSASTLIGGIVLAQAFNQSSIESSATWFTNVAADYMITLPVVLLLPSPREMHHAVASFLARRDYLHLVPLLILLASVALSAAIGGAGAIAIPVPALILCALRYGMPGTVFIIFAVGMFLMYATGHGWFNMGVGIDTAWQRSSFNFGLSMVVLGPLTVAITEQSRQAATRTLEFLASSDSLTGLLNRTTFRQRGEALLASARSTDVPVAVLMLDIDLFKQTNDTDGHLVGDEILMLVAVILREELPDSALLGRFGGEEFVVMMEDIDDEALLLANTVREAFETRQQDFDGRLSNRVTISVGVATTHQAGAVTLHSLLLDADQALYLAKESGRDQAIAAQARY